jgi:hypothetical protein
VRKWATPHTHLEQDPVQIQKIDKMMTVHHKHLGLVVQTLGTARKSANSLHLAGLQLACHQLVITVIVGPMNQKRQHCPKYQIVQQALA